MATKIEELEKELKKAKEEEFRKREEEIRLAKDKIPTSVWVSDDYFYADIDWFSFYYWYEETHCPKHPKIDDCEDEYDCDKREWCFTASIWDKQVMKIPASKLAVNWNIEEYLISWMLMFIKKFIPKTKWWIYA